MREAAQALLLAEMRRIGKSGRKQLITYWTQFMPNILEDGNGTVSLAAAELDLSAVNEGVFSSFCPNTFFENTCKQ